MFADSFVAWCAGGFLILSGTAILFLVAARAMGLIGE